jgi:hypothetical protein
MKPSRTSARRSGKNTVTMKVDMSAVDAMLAKLDGDIQKAVRPAAQAAADVYYKAVLKNVDAIGSVTGNLRSSIYQVFSEDKSVAVDGGYRRATYHVSWNAKTAPHAHMIEFGYIQRYAVRIGKDGRWYTEVRPEHRGDERTGEKRTKPPKRRASQAEKDAYYVLRRGGPVQWLARPFLRPAYTQAREAAIAAAVEKIAEVISK